MKVVLPGWVLRAAQQFVSKDTSRPELMAIAVREADDMLEILATNGHVAFYHSVKGMDWVIEGYPPPPFYLHLYGKPDGDLCVVDCPLVNGFGFLFKGNRNSSDITALPIEQKRIVCRVVLADNLLILNTFNLIKELISPPADTPLETIKSTTLNANWLAMAAKVFGNKGMYVQQQSGQKDAALICLPSKQELFSAEKTAVVIMPMIEQDGDDD